MKNSSKYCVVLTACGSKEEADKIARGLLENKLAACIQTTDITSYYEWENKFNKDDEVLLLIKSRDLLYSKIEKYIIENHSYKVPEIIKTDITDGFNKYFSWIDESTN